MEYNSNNVGVIGFSAGGHLASTISTKGKLGLINQILQFYFIL